MKIKIIQIENATRGSYGDEVDFRYITSETQWTEISDDEYNVLLQYLDRNKYYIITELSQPEILRTVEQCLEKATKAKEKYEVEEKKRRDRKNKLKATKEARELKKLTIMAEKYGVKIDVSDKN